MSNNPSQEEAIFKAACGIQSPEQRAEYWTGRVMGMNRCFAECGGWFKFSIKNRAFLSRQ